LMEGDNELYSKKRVMIFWFRWMQVEWYFLITQLILLDCVGWDLACAGIDWLASWWACLVCCCTTLPYGSPKQGLNEIQQANNFH
jgi:hypothetical protein